MEREVADFNPKSEEMKTIESANNINSSKAAYNKQS